MISEGLKSNSTLTELYLCGYGKKKKKGNRRNNKEKEEEEDGK